MQKLRLLDGAIYAGRVFNSRDDVLGRCSQRSAQTGQRVPCWHLCLVLLDQAEAPLRDARKSGQLYLAEASQLA